MLALPVDRSLGPYTVEEFQSFSKSRGTSLPWLNVICALFFLSLCDLAAAHIIKACGRDEVMKQTLGSTKWWQVRDTQGCVYRDFQMSQLTHICDHGVKAERVTAKKTRGPHQRKHRGKLEGVQLEDLYQRAHRQTSGEEAMG